MTAPTATWSAPGTNGTTITITDSSRLINLVSNPSWVTGSTLTVPSGHTLGARRYLASVDGGPDQFIGTPVWGPFGFWLPNWDPFTLDDIEGNTSSTTGTTFNITLKSTWAWTGPSSTSGTVTATRTATIQGWPDWADDTHPPPFYPLWYVQPAEDSSNPVGTVLPLLSRPYASLENGGTLYANDPTADAALDTIEAFPTRKNLGLARMRDLAPSGTVTDVADPPSVTFDYLLTRGMARLELEYAKPAASRSATQIAQANTEIRQGCDAIAAARDLALANSAKRNGWLPNGAALTYLRCYLRYVPTGLLTTVTRDYLKSKMRVWLNDMLASSVPGASALFKVNFPTRWDSAAPSSTTTETQLLTLCVTGMLLCEMYAGENFNGKPVKGSTTSTSYSTSYWHWFRDAFYQVNNKYEHWTKRPIKTENGLTTLHANLGVYLSLVDLHSDTAVARQAEVLYDRLLLGVAAHLSGHILTGAKEKTSSQGYWTGSPIWAGAYLLFDTVGPLPAYKGWSNYGRWWHMGILCGTYTPANTRFPRSLVHRARSHLGENGSADIDENGNGQWDFAPTHGDEVVSGNLHRWNFTANDYGVGAMARGTAGPEDISGGFFACTDTPLVTAGLIPFSGDGPFTPNRPTRTVKAVGGCSGGTGLICSAVPTTGTDLKQKLWRSTTGWTEVALFPNSAGKKWLLGRVTSPTPGREIYVGVRQFGGDIITGGGSGAASQGGTTYTFTHPTNPIVFFTADSDMPIAEGWTEDRVYSIPPEVYPEGFWTWAKFKEFLLLNLLEPVLGKSNVANRFYDSDYTDPNYWHFSWPGDLFSDNCSVLFSMTDNNHIWQSGINYGGIVGARHVDWDIFLHSAHAETAGSVSSFVGWPWDAGGTAYPTMIADRYGERKALSNTDADHGLPDLANYYTPGSGWKTEWAWPTTTIGVLPTKTEQRIGFKAAITAVEVYINTISRGLATWNKQFVAYTYNWDTTGWATGTHTLQFRYFLEDGTVVLSQPHHLTLT